MVQAKRGDGRGAKTIWGAVWKLELPGQGVPKLELGNEGKRS